MDCCTIVKDQFDAERVAAKLDRRRRKGPANTTVRLVETLAGLGVDGLTLLDVGAGFGDVQKALFALGLADASHVEISEPYALAADEIARNEGYADRVEQHLGDFVTLAPDLRPADIVTLDRVICCYADMPSLIELSTARSRRFYAVSMPRSGWPIRVGWAVKNLRRRWGGSRFRSYVYSTRDVDRRIRRKGFLLLEDCSTLFWKVSVYERSG